MSRGKPIKCRLMVPSGDNWIEFRKLPEAEKRRISSEYAERMGAAMNDGIRDPAAFEKLR